MAVDALLKRLTDERDQKLQLIDNMAGVADEAGRDLYDNELETVESAQSRVRSLNTQIDRLSVDLELADTTRDRIRSLDPSVIARDFAYPTAGEYLYDCLHQRDNSDAKLRLGKFHKRAAEHMGLDKDNTVPVAGGFNGLVISPISGPVLDPLPAGRPLFTALGPRPITSSSFMRPRIIDPTNDGVGPQGQEKSELPSKAWEIDSEQVKAEVIGGYINVSELLIEMLPGSLDMVISHMNRRLAKATEEAAVGKVDATTASIPLAANADSAAIVAAIGQAAALVVENTGFLPTWIAFGPKAWGRLIGITDLAGRPLLPAIGPVNTLGTGQAGGYPGSFSGLSVVVSPAIQTANIYIGNQYGLEAYERKVPVLQAIEPSVYGRQVAVVSHVAWYTPITTESPDGIVPPEREGVVKIAWAA